MDYVHEMITPEDKIPIKIFVSSIKNVQRHWHNSLEIMLLLEGRLTFFIDNEEKLLKEDDFVIINSNQIHALQQNSESNLLLTLQMPKLFLKSVGVDLDEVSFEKDEYKLRSTEFFEKLRSLMSEIALTYIRKEKFYEVKIAELTNKFIYILCIHFGKKKDVSQLSNDNLDKLSLAIDEIQENYNSQLTLNDVATVQGLSRNYFANFFKKYMGTTFLEYLNGVRLGYAYKELISTSKTITEIALDNGFPNTKAFSKLFRDVFDETPSAFRSSKQKSKTRKEVASSISYFDIEGVNKHKLLYKYLLKPEKQKALLESTYQTRHTINTKLKGSKVNKNPLSLITFGRASTGLKANLQKQLIETQKEIGFSYVRFHGILDDDMQVYTEDTSGNSIYNFTLINSLLDFLLEIKLKPFLEIAFMPSALAKGNDSLWNGKSFISMPKDMNKWNELIKNIFKNFINRYGIDEVLKWKFEVWNEPEYYPVMWRDTPKDFFEFWENTFKTIKKIDDGFQVGGPSIFINTLWSGKWFQQYVYHCKTSGTEPDFLTLHFYPLVGLDYTLTKQFENEEVDYDKVIANWDKTIVGTQIEISSNPNILYTEIQKAKEVLLTYQWEHLPIYLTEWNATTWQRDLTSDTTYKSAYITKNIMENIKDIDGFGYWTISDYMDEISFESELFQGGFGLMTMSGIKKPSYYSFSFLKSLGNVLLEQGENYSVFRNNKTIKILMYNYIPFNTLYRKFDTQNISQTNRYDVFESNSSIQITISLQMEVEGEYSCREQNISRESGSSLDEWLRMGAPKNLSLKDQEILQNLSVPKTLFYTKIANPVLEIIKKLEPNQVTLIEIRKI